MKCIPILLLILLNSNYALSDCRQGFSFLVGGTASLDYINETYEQIFNELGTKLTPVDFQKIFESGNPYELSEGIHLESDTLASTLKEFSELVKNSGVELREVTKILLKSVEKRIKGIKKTEVKTEEIHKQNNIPTQVLYGDNYLNNPEFTPDGKSLITTDNQYGFWYSDNFTKFKKLKNGLNPSFKFLGSYYTEKQDYIYLTTGKVPLNTYRVRIRDDSGKLLTNWVPELWYHREPNERYDDDNIYSFTFSDNGKWFAAEMKDGVYVLSTETPAKNTLAPIFAMPPLDSIRILRFLPGQENLLIIGSDSIRNLNLKGEEIIPSVKLNWSEKEAVKRSRIMAFAFHDDKFALNQDHKIGYTSHNEGLLEVNLLTGIVDFLPVIEGSTLPKKTEYKYKPDYQSVRLDPSEKYVFVLVSNDHPDHPSRILTYDIAKRITVKETFLPNKKCTSFNFSPDQSLILINDLDFRGVNLLRTEDLLPE